MCDLCEHMYTDHPYSRNELRIRDGSFSPTIGCSFFVASFAFLLKVRVRARKVRKIIRKLDIEK